MKYELIESIRTIETHPGVGLDYSTQRYEICLRGDDGSFLKIYADDVIYRVPDVDNSEHPELNPSALDVPFDSKKQETYVSPFTGKEV